VCLNEQRFPKFEAYQKRIAEEYGQERPAYLNRIAWWDAGNLKLSSLSNNKKEMDQNENKCKVSTSSSQQNPNNEELKQLMEKLKLEREFTQKLKNEITQLKDEISQKQQTLQKTVQRATITFFGAVGLVLVMAVALFKTKITERKDHPL
jgi:chromosome segregation ATPase